MPDPTLFVDQCIAYRIDPGRSAQAVAGPLSPVMQLCGSGDE